jgi:HlyD family secretion protein
MSGGPRQDNRDGGRHWPQEPRGSAFGPRGAALLGALRRLPGNVDRQPYDEPPVPPANQNTPPEAGASRYAPRKRSAGPDARKGGATGSVRDWLERHDIGDDPRDDRPRRVDRRKVEPEPKPSPSVLRFDASLRRPAPPSGERPRAESISNIHDLRIGDLQSPQRVAEPQPSPAAPRQARARPDPVRPAPTHPPAGRPAPAHPNPARGAPDRPVPPRRRETPFAKTQARNEAIARGARDGLSFVVTRGGQLVDYFRVPSSTDADGADLTGSLRRGFQDELRTGLRVLMLGVGLVGGWAVLVPLSSAITLPGTLVVESSVKKIQYPAGGVIAEIKAQDGMHVKEGDLLVRIDETQLRANVQVLSDQLEETRARIARLTAERDGAEAPKMPGEPNVQAGGEDPPKLLVSETSLFKARLSTRESQKQLLRSNIAQLQEQIDGIEAQIKAKSAQLDLISSELKGVQTLFDKQLVPLTRLTSLQREAAQLDGERSQLRSSIAETRSKISQAELQIVKIDQDLRSDVMKEMREAQDKESELTQKVVAARDQLNRVEIRSPTSGVVHQLTVHTIGGVVTAGEVIMEIVPDSDDLQIEAKLPPVDIDHVHLDQEVLVRFSAFNQRTTPQLHGVVSYVSADLTQDAQNKSTSSSSYTIRVKLTADELKHLGNLQLVSGMPAELFLQTGSRTMMSYLLKPITDQLKRTFSEP